MERRAFIRHGAMAAAVLATPQLFVQSLEAAPRSRKLICIFLRGGADALSMVAPFGESDYYERRPTIALPAPSSSSPETLLDLDGFFGMHPALRELHQIYQRGELAIVHAVGSPERTHSHVSAQLCMETACIDATEDQAGWLAGVMHDGAIAASLGSAPQRSLRGAQCKTIQGGVRNLARALRDDEVQLGFIDSSVWDTHYRQGGSNGLLATRLRGLSRTVRLLYDELGDGMDDVVIMIMSEFGRSAQENPWGGTDHGHGGVMLLLGGAVKGGQVHARWAGLQDDLPVTTDFRAVYAEVAERHLRVRNAAALFPGYLPEGRARLMLIR